MLLTVVIRVTDEVILPRDCIRTEALPCQTALVPEVPGGMEMAQPLELALGGEQVLGVARRRRIS